MRYLKAPAGVASAQVEGQDIKIVDGIAKVEDSLVPHLKPHGFTEFSPGDHHDPRPPATLPTGQDVFVAAIANMSRPHLFAIAKEMRVALAASLTTEAMRAVLIKHATEHPTDRPPAKRVTPPPPQKAVESEPDAEAVAKAKVDAAASQASAVTQTDPAKDPELAG